MKLKAISNDKWQLVICFWLIKILGLIILLCSIIASGFLQLKYTINCKNKAANQAEQCTLESSVYSVYHTTTDIGHLTQAVVNSRLSNKGGTTYWIDLLTDKGAITLGGGSSSGRDNKDKAAEAINQYISNSVDTHFEIPYPTPWWAYALAGVFVLLGFVLMFGIRGATIEFDRISQSVHIKRKGLFKLKETTLMFANIEKIIVEQSRDARGSTTYRLAFALKDKTTLPFVKTYDSSNTKKEAFAKQLNEFMSLKVV